MHFLSDAKLDEQMFLYVQSELQGVQEDAQSIEEKIEYLVDGSVIFVKRLRRKFVRDTLALPSLTLGSGFVRKPPHRKWEVMPQRFANAGMIADVVMQDVCDAALAPPPDFAIRDVILPVRHRRVGVDIGGVLVKHRADWDGNGAWELNPASMVSGAVEGLRHIIAHLGPEIVCLVSCARAGGRSGGMRRKIEVWLHSTMQICSLTGLLADNIVFTDHRTGARGKGPVAER